MDADSLTLMAEELPQTFSDLHTGFAGELFQKLVNYQIHSVLVLPDFNAYGQRFSELAYEHQERFPRIPSTALFAVLGKLLRTACGVIVGDAKEHPQIRFVRTLDEAWAWLWAEHNQCAHGRTGC
mgnify:CR=1 FL=1